MKTPLIASERLVLDAFTVDDAAAVLDCVDDEELQRYIPVPIPYTLEHATQYVTEYADETAASAGKVLWAVREDAVLAGALELRIADGSGDIGYWVGRAHRGRGIMTEAVGMLVEYGFDPLGFDLARLTWSASAGNRGSAIVVQRNGFTFEGLRRSGVVVRERRDDEWVASLLRGDSRELVDGWPL